MADLDLLAIAPDGALVLIELKRERTPREVAQAIDYACWVEGLDAGNIAAIYQRFAPGRDLAADFLARFGQPLNEDTLNESLVRSLSLPLISMIVANGLLGTGHSRRRKEHRD